MGDRAWRRLLLCGMVLCAAARVAAAQEQPSRDEELNDLRRRLEILENERRAKEETPSGAAVAADPLEEKWYDRVHVGGGVRTTFRTVTKQAPNGHNPSLDFALESGRLYTNGKITENLSATLNAEFTAGGASVLDAIAQIKVADEFNIFLGRMLPATDRSNSDGPYYLSTWDFPFLSDAFNAVGTTGDRDTGITFWGDISHFKYWAGIYEGNEHAAAGRRDDLLYAARVQYDFMDAETGYYLSSTYYGDKKVLAVGLVANYQTNAAGTAALPRAYGNVALDFLWEQKFDFGTPNVELAYYYFGRHGFDSAIGGAGPFDLGAGSGFLATFAFLIPGQVGWGQFQPHIRYQGFNEIDSGTARNPSPSNVSRWDLGVNYVMKGHDARISMVYSHTDFSGPAKNGMLVIGTQFQF